jgi:hypothetical protein
MLDTKKREEVRKQAKEIMDKFAKSLGDVKEKVEEDNVEREQDRRKEGEGKTSNSDFREIIFENAPNKNKDYIIGEKKKWE